MVGTVVIGGFWSKFKRLGVEMKGNGFCWCQGWEWSAGRESDFGSSRERFKGSVASAPLFPALLLSCPLFWDHHLSTRPFDPAILLALPRDC